MILAVQLGANTNEAKLFKAHAAPLGLCDSLFNAHKLLANQQKDGDSPVQSFVTGLHERSRRGITDGLRSFIQADNHSAVDVGHLHQGTRSLKVQKPQISEAFPEASIREGTNELTLRADEVGTHRAFISTEHIEFERWGPPLVDADRHVLCQAIYKGIEGEESEELYYHYREMSQATGARKPSASHKAKAFWTMKAAWDRSEEYYDPARNEDILGRTKIRLDLREEHLKDPIAALAKALECLEKLFWCWLLVCSFCCQSWLQWLAVLWARRFCKRGGKGLPGKASGLAWIHGTLCVCARHPAIGTQRAFLLLYREGAGGSFEGSSVQALRLCGDAPGVCADWFTPSGSTR